MSHADMFCTIERHQEKSWMWQLVFQDTDAIVKAYRSIRDREPAHANRSSPYKAVCRRLSVLLLVADQRPGGGDADGG